MIAIIVLLQKRFNVAEMQMRRHIVNTVTYRKNWIVVCVTFFLSNY